MCYHETGFKENEVFSIKSVFMKDKGDWNSMGRSRTLAKKGAGLLALTAAAFMLVMLFLPRMGNWVVAEAADEAILCYKKGTAVKDQTVKADFKVENEGTVDFLLYAKQAKDIEVSIVNRKGKTIAPAIKMDKETDWATTSSGTPVAALYRSLPAGNFTLKIKFSAKASYELYILQTPSISANKIEVTEGFAEKLSVTNTKSEVAWS